MNGTTTSLGIECCRRESSIVVSDWSLLSPDARRSNAIRSEFGPPGTHRRFAALGWHALSQFQPGATRRSRGSHAVDRASSSAAAMRRVPSAPLPSVNPLDSWLRRPDSGLRATWLGHSTVLIEIDGWRVLTDPVWGPRASPSRFLGPKRFQPVPDRAARAAAARRGRRSRTITTIISTTRPCDCCANAPCPSSRRWASARTWKSFGIAPQRIVELDWWESHRVPGTDLTLTAAPSQHFSGRGLKDGNKTLWSSFVIQSHAPSRIFQWRHRPDAPNTPRSARASGRSTW